MGFIIGALSMVLVSRYMDVSNVEVDKGPILYEDSEVGSTLGEPEGLEDEPLPPSPPKPRIAIVIDDLGQNLNGIDELFNLGVPLTIAVMPHLRYSSRVAEEAHSRGMDVLLHLPMEPKDMVANNPGKGLLSTKMNEEEIATQLDMDLDSVPFITGVNNHMGSKFTEDEKRMRVVLSVLKDKGHFFFDSLTTPNSVGREIAAQMGISTAERNVFLDNKQDKEYVKAQFDLLVKIAKREGFAIAIGHPHSATIEGLKEALAGIEDKGVSVVKLSELVE